MNIPTKGVYLVNLNKNMLSGLAIVALTLSSATAFAKKPNIGHLFNPNTPSLTVVNSISDVYGHVGGFINTDGTIHGDMFHPNCYATG